MRGNELDLKIEEELRKMLNEGFDETPISAKSLHRRLKNKGYVRGGLSTLSVPNRVEMIKAYREKQIIRSNMSQVDKKILFEQSRQSAPAATYSPAKRRTKHIERLFDANTVKVALIVEEAVRVGLDVDRIFAPYFLEESTLGFK